MHVGGPTDLCCEGERKGMGGKIWGERYGRKGQKLYKRGRHKGAIEKCKENEIEFQDKLGTT